jgi:putative transcriptional regulator
MDKVNPIKAELEERVRAEVARVGSGRIDMKLIAALFVQRGISRATAYRWIKQAVDGPTTKAPGKRRAAKARLARTEGRPSKQPTQLRVRPAPLRRSRRPHVVDVRAIRDRLDLSQDRFARRFGFSLAAVRQWEAGTRQPDAAACVLLLLINKQPHLVAATVVEWEAMQAEKEV